MRVFAIALVVVGALVSLYIPISGYQNSINAGVPFLLAIPIIGLVLAALGLAGGVLTLQSRKLGPLLLILATVGGFAAWPWLAAGVVYLLATVVSFMALRAGTRGGEAPGRSA